MYYEVLGVTPDASEAALRSAYRRAVKDTHPDRGGNVEAFRTVQDAWAVLGDPARRQAYAARTRSATSSSLDSDSPPRKQTGSPPSATARPTPQPRPQPPRPETLEPGEQLPATSWLLRHRTRILQVLLALTATVTGSLTLQVMSTIGRPVTAAAAAYLAAMAVCLALRAVGNQAGEGTYRRLILAAWILVGVCAGSAPLTWATNRDYLPPIVWAAFLAAFAGSVMLLGRTIRRP